MPRYFTIHSIYHKTVFNNKAMLRRNVTFCFLLSGLSQINLAQASAKHTQNADRKRLNILHKCIGFSFNPQTADAGTSMNVVTEQIYNKLFDIKDHSAALVPVLAQSYSLSSMVNKFSLIFVKG